MRSTGTACRIEVLIHLKEIIPKCPQHFKRFLDLVGTKPHKRCPAHGGGGHGGAVITDAAWSPARRAERAEDDDAAAVMAAPVLLDQLTQC